MDGDQTPRLGFFGNDGLFHQAWTGWDGIPVAGWFLALCAGMASGAVDLLYWANSEVFSWNYALLLAPLSPVWLGALYVSAIGIVGKPASLPGYLRFAATTLATIAPAVLSLLALVYGELLWAKNERDVIFLVAVVLGLALASLLPAWPLAQAVSPSFVSPLRVLQATKGHRSALILLALALSGLRQTDLVPKLHDATDWSTAVSTVLWGVLVSILFAAFTAGVAAASWRFAARNDPSLR